jgi:hypothetical protein
MVDETVVSVWRPHAGEPAAGGVRTKRVSPLNFFIARLPMWFWIFWIAPRALGTTYVSTGRQLGRTLTDLQKVFWAGGLGLEGEEQMVGRQGHFRRE